MSLKTLLPFSTAARAASSDVGDIKAATGPSAETVEHHAPQDQNALVAQMISSARSALLLRPQIAQSLQPAQLRRAMEALRADMSHIEGGSVPVVGRNWHADPGDEDPVHPRTSVVVNAYWLDRHQVTNQQYQSFVRGGGYQQLTLWDEVIRSALEEFADQTGRMGPRFWRDGRFPSGQENHPVVGICWYEANAYARWVGKRLPMDAEWIKAASWPTPAGGKSVPRKFPWGDVFDRAKANLWESEVGSTVAVDAFPTGDSPCHVRQLIGNVWEWTSSDFAEHDQGQDIDSEAPLKSLRGGAFDTYFAHQASWRFQSGDHVLARRHNVGFRCALCACDVANCTEPSS
jgi:Uncharacterized conserved protein